MLKSPMVTVNGLRNVQSSEDVNLSLDGLTWLGTQVDLLFAHCINDNSAI